MTLRPMTIALLLAGALALPARAQVPSATPPAGAPWLGVQLEPAPDADGTADTAPRGAMIAWIVRRSPADRAGLQAGDLLVALDGATVEGVQPFISALRTHPPGSGVRLDVTRRGRTRTVLVTLDEQPPAERWRDYKTGWAGITPLDVPEQLRRYWGAGEREGVLLAAVAEDGPAWAAGARPGDLLLTFDDRPIASAGQLSGLVRRSGDGNKVVWRLSRQGTALTVEVLLALEPPPPEKEPAREK